MYYLVSSSDCTGADQSTSYYVVVCTSVLVSFPDFVARAGVRVAWVRTSFGNKAKVSYTMQSRADDSCCHIKSQSVCDYRIAQKFRGSKFSRIAVFENFVEIISRIHSPKHATPTLCTGVTSTVRTELSLRGSGSLLA